MATISQNLEKYLPSVAYEAIQEKFKDDLSQITGDNGVTYTYNGHTWNVKIGSAPGISSIFVRAHSKEKILGYQFSERPNNNIFEKNIEVSKQSICNGRSGPNGVPKESHRQFEFLKIIREGKLQENMEIPKVPQTLANKVTHFFPPDSNMLPPTFIPQKPAAQKTENKVLSNFVQLGVIFAVVYIIAKISKRFFGAQEVPIKALNS